MNERIPPLRTDLEFFPLLHEGQELLLIRDHLGLVADGKALPSHLFQFLTLLDGNTTIRDLQMLLMQQRGSVLVPREEIEQLLAELDDLFLLDSEHFRRARARIVDTFSVSKVRPCSHAGRAYPKDTAELRRKLDEILASPTAGPIPEGAVTALVAPHIDLAVGAQVYASAYRLLESAAPTRVVLLGVGHRMGTESFCLTDKDFATPLGLVENEPAVVEALRGSGAEVVADNDFAHCSEHALEFQLIFLQHLLSAKPFTIIPILCGALPAAVSGSGRRTYLEKAGPFLEKLKEISSDSDTDTLVVAGVDFSHIGPKFGHELPAIHLEDQSTSHDQKLLYHLSRQDPDSFWQESIQVEDRFNVCGFSTLACLLEILPPCRGKILNYQVWHEEATRSAVSFGAVAFTAL